MFPRAFRANNLGGEQLVSKVVTPSQPSPYQYPNLYEYAVSVDKKGKANQISLSGDFRLSQQTFNNYAGYFKLYINQQQVPSRRHSTPPIAMVIIQGLQTSKL